ncbi:MAG: single-stranded-DNA-specific exonuclease RecJ [Hydrotalea sp.]|nr:single-stranded-DNA-specific exonuclease RecJ [Hydrotalea sp.]
MNQSAKINTIPVASPPAVAQQPNQQHWRPVVASSLSNQAWLAARRDELAIRSISEQAAVSLTLAEIITGFYNIAEETVTDFLQPKIKNLMTDPYDLKGMASGVAAMARAIKEKKTIALFGDYDVDGAASIALLYRYLTHLGCRVIFHVPDRLRDGYGPNKPAIEKLLADGAELIVFLDCGTSALDLLLPLTNQAGDKKCQIIIIDHHLSEPIPPLPDSLSLINPNRFDEKNNYGYLCAAGVSFLFLVALQKNLRDAGEKNLPDLMGYLDLVALATVGDVVPLTQLNRAFVKQGLVIMSAQQNIGLMALLELLAIDSTLSAGQLSFYLCPSINAGGRLGFSGLGATLLTTNDVARAREIALSLHQYNEERKIIEQQLVMNADAIIMGDKSLLEKNLLMVEQPAWHVGVLGIVASRLKDKYHRPAIVGGMGGDDDGKDAGGKKNMPQVERADDVITASARSYAGIDIGAAIMAARQADLLIAGGGHKMAGGFKCYRKNWQAAKDFITHHIDKQCNGTLPQSTKKIAATLPLAALSTDLAIEMEQLEPFGTGNRTPLIMVKNAVFEKAVWLKEQHLSVFFSGDGMAKRSLRAMMFRAVNNKTAQHLAASKRGAKFHLLGELYANDWQGNKSVDFFLVDAAPTEE